MTMTLTATAERPKSESHPIGKRRDQAGKHNRLSLQKGSRGWLPFFFVLPDVTPVIPSATNLIDLKD
jgi:hypothetical protein